MSAYRFFLWKRGTCSFHFDVISWEKYFDVMKTEGKLDNYSCTSPGQAANPKLPFYEEMYVQQWKVVIETCQ